MDQTMEDESNHHNIPTTSPTSNNGDPSGSVRSSSSSPPSSSSSSHVQEEQEDDSDQQQEEEEQEEREREEEQQQQRQQQIGVTYLPNISMSESPDSTDDAWSCFAVLITFWFFASMTLIVGLYGSSNLQVGPTCSQLIQSNSLLVSEIRVHELSGPKHGMMLYGFEEPPPLDGEITWSENLQAALGPNNHKEWIYFLNKGSEVDITYSVISGSSYPLSLVIAEGEDDFIEWVEDPSYPNLTLSWNIVHGNGTIRQKIFKSLYYYVAVGNLNPEEVEVQLRLKIQAAVYNTSNAYCKCSLAHGPCDLALYFMGTNAAVLTTPGPEQDPTGDIWSVKLSYEPRWISYLLGSGAMTTIFVILFKICTNFHANSPYTAGSQAGERGTERTPLLTHKDDDLSSWGSSYDSVSHDEDDLEDFAAGTSLEAKPLKDGENSNPRRLCVICFDAPRDCFFLPCGHCAACFTCGTRIVEEAGTCPICRRKMKKVRKIFAV